MARMLGRSKSLRLKSSQKDLHQRETDSPAPLPPTPHEEESRDDLHSLKAAAPAPHPAQRADSPEQVQRPRTASAPGDRGRHIFHQKPPPVVVSSDEGTFSFRLPSPETVLYAAEIHEDDMIGMALGSPTTPATYKQPGHSTDFVSRPGLNRTFTHIAYDPSFDSSLYEDGSKTFTTNADAGHDVTKPKLSRWKSLFGRKNTTPQPFYQLQQTSAPAPRVDTPNDVPSNRERSSSRTSRRAASPPRAPTSAREIREARKNAKAAKKAAAEEEKFMLDSGKHFTPRHDHMKTESSPKPPPKDNWHRDIPTVTVSGGSQTTSPGEFGSGPLLDVDIPNVEMERYSVMFGSLLGANRSSSLLIRRQADPGKLKPLTELSKKKDHTDTSHGLLKPTRRATSPSPAKSPTFSLSLFPPPSQSRDTRSPSPRIPSMHRPRPLQRSHTAPSISPSRQTFAKPAEPRLHKLAEADPEQLTELLTPTPSTRQSFDSVETAVVPVVIGIEPWSPRLEEPEWEIVSKPAELPASQLQRDVQAPQPQEAPPRAQKMQNEQLQATVFQSPPKPSRAAPQKSPESHFTPTISPLGTKPKDSPLLHQSPKDSPRLHQSPKDSPRLPLHHSPKQSPHSRTSPRDRAPSASASASANAKPPVSVGLARQVSVTRSTAPKLLKPMLLSPAGSEKLVDRKPMTPTLVELKNRKSQRGYIEDA